MIPRSLPHLHAAQLSAVSALRALYLSCTALEWSHTPATVHEAALEATRLLIGAKTLALIDSIDTFERFVARLEPAEEALFRLQDLCVEEMRTNAKEAI